MSKNQHTSKLQFGILGEDAHCLVDTQIGHDFFTATQNSLVA
jgi:hypothetical protein